MKKILILTFSICLFISNNILNADEKTKSNNYLNDFKFGFNSLYLKNNTLQESNESGKIVSGLKSYKKAILFSGLVPGVGEIYNDSVIKGLFFIGVEVTGWSFYFTSKNKGEDIENEFQLFADANWSKDRYNDCLELYKQVNGRDPVNLSHELPQEKDQQYYEMIGKYDQFACGWNDCNEWDGLSQKRLNYEDKRYQSNKYLKRSITMTSIIFVNRIASLIDTIWGVKLHNDRIRNEKIVNIVPFEYRDEIIPAVCFKIKW
jgi:hypothetical protein